MIDWTSHLLCVAGLPSGGTSAVAGVLHYLGVDMGRLDTHKERCERAGGLIRRNYENFECLDYATWIATGVKGGAFNYARQRLSKPGRHGWKGMVWSLGLTECSELPIRVLRVNRDPDAVRKSRVRYGQSADGAERQVEGLDRLCLQHPPIHTVEYDELIAAPDIIVTEIIRSLGLTPTAEQFQSAVEYVSPTGCQILMQPQAIPA